MTDFKINKSATNRKQFDYQINRVVVESYTSIRGNTFQIDNKKGINKSVQTLENQNLKNAKNIINNNSQSITLNNLKNIDQDVNKNNLINIDNNNKNIKENISNINMGDNSKIDNFEQKIEYVKKIEETEKNIVNNNILNNLNKNIPELSLCKETNFNLTSHIKSFELPLSISKSSLNYLNKQKIEKNELKQSIDNKEKNTSRKNYIITTISSIFIGGGQNLKGKSIHLSKNSPDNLVHKEIMDTKTNKNKSIEKVDISLDNLVEALKAISKRWKESQKESKIRLSYIPKNEILILNKKRYVDDLVKSVTISPINNKNTKKEYYILIKQDNQNNSENFVHEIISPSSHKELENSINNFINLKDKNINTFNKEYNKRTSQNIIHISDKKKSKLTKNNEMTKKNAEENWNNNEKEYFNPVFILNLKQIKNLLTILEKKSTQKNSRSNSINNSSQKIIDKPKKREIPKEKLKDLNFNIFPVKVEKFEFIHTALNEIGTGGGNNLLINNNIDISNIALNQSDFNYIKQVKGESEYSAQKVKESEDFSQCTPISLLKDKYFVYAVSKWAKYSKVSQQSQLFIKFTFKSGHPKFDPILLDMTNFTLWIEKIQTKKNSKQILAHTNSGNTNYNIKKNSSSKINNTKNKAFKSGAAIFLSDSNNQNDGINQVNKKKSKSKTKIEKKKNQ